MLLRAALHTDFPATQNSLHAPVIVGPGPEPPPDCSQCTQTIAVRSSMQIMHAGSLRGFVRMPPDVYHRSRKSLILYGMRSGQWFHNVAEETMCQLQATRKLSRKSRTNLIKKVQYCQKIYRCINVEQIIVLCVCVLFVFLFLSPIHHSRWGAAPNAQSECGAQWLPDRPESIWNPSCTQQLESTGGPAIRGKPLRHRTLQQSNSWAENPTSPSALARMLDPPQSGSSSSAAIQLLHSIWSNRRNRGTVCIA